MRTPPGMGIRGRGFAMRTVPLKAGMSEGVAGTSPRHVAAKAMRKRGSERCILDWRTAYIERLDYRLAGFKGSLRIA